MQVKNKKVKDNEQRKNVSYLTKSRGRADFAIGRTSCDAKL